MVHFWVDARYYRSKIICWVQNKLESLTGRVPVVESRASVGLRLWEGVVPVDSRTSCYSRHNLKVGEKSLDLLEGTSNFLFLTMRLGFLATWW